MSDKSPTRHSAAPQDCKYGLRLYVTGGRSKSNLAITNLKAICETHFKDRYDLTIIDLYTQKNRAREDQIVVSPTLIRYSPLPVRRMIGDLSQTNRVLAALDFVSGRVFAMIPTAYSNEQLRDKVVDLRARLDEANKILRTIRIDGVDAVLVQGLQGRQVFTLKGADESYRVLIEEMNQGAVTLSADGSILYCNRRFADLLKMPTEKIVGLDFSAFVALSERAGFADLLAAARLGGSAGEITLCAGDESAVPLQLALGPLPAESAAAICLVATDISESREKEEAKDRFLANMSHELRTPLNGIIGFAEFLVDGKPGSVNPKQKEYLEDILNSGKHLLVLINDVLDLAKVGAGKMELKPEKFSLRKAIEEACAVTTPIVQKKGIRLEVNVAPELGYVTLDQQKFKQVLYNLLSNAIKFNPHGGKVEIRVAMHDAHRFKLSVQDAGIGIKKEDLRRLFKEFEQLESGASCHHEGTGLGLALTRKIVELQGGTIGVESEIGQGSLFTVVLPLVLAEANV
jgi:PAS domain S-box-containing protein